PGCSRYQQALGFSPCLRDFLVQVATRAMASHRQAATSQTCIRPARRLAHFDVEQAGQAPRVVVDEAASPLHKRAELHTAVELAQVQRGEGVKLPAAEMAVC